MGVLLLFAVGLLILIIIADYKLYEKAGEEGWKSLIPFYSIYIMIKIAFNESKLWLFLIYMLSPIGTAMGEGSSIGIALNLIGLIAAVYLQFKFVKRFADTGMAVMSLFVPFITYPILAFSDKYQYKELSSNE